MRPSFPRSPLAGSFSLILHIAVSFIPSPASSPSFILSILTAITLFEAHSTSCLNYCNCLLSGLSTSSYSLLLNLPTISPLGYLSEITALNMSFPTPNSRCPQCSITSQLKSKLPRAFQRAASLSPAISYTPLHTGIIGSSSYSNFLNSGALCPCHVKCLSTAVLVH